MNHLEGTPSFTAIKTRVPFECIQMFGVPNQDGWAMLSIKMSCGVESVIDQFVKDINSTYSGRENIVLYISIECMADLAILKHRAFDKPKPSSRK